MNIKVRERFTELVQQPDDQIKLDEAALLIAAESEEQLDIPHYLNLLDDLAIQFQQKPEGTLGVSVNGLINFIHVEQGFDGDAKNYYDPENSFLNHVIDTRRGIPISLALIHLSLGKRLNIPVQGINFPGHFLIQYGSEQHAIVDPFAGRVLSKADCSTLLKQIAGPKAILQDEYFETANNRDILIRILDNLKQIFWRKKNWEESKACLDRQLLLLPKRVEFNVQLGALHEMQGNLGLAQHAYINVLQETKDAQLRKIASKRLLALESKPGTIH